MSSLRKLRSQRSVFYLEFHFILCACAVVWNVKLYDTISAKIATVNGMKSCTESTRDFHALMEFFPTVCRIFSVVRSSGVAERCFHWPQ